MTLLGRKRNAIAIATLALWSSSAGAQQTREKLIEYLDSIARTKLGERAQAIGRIQTKAEAEKRSSEVRQKLLRLIGGLPPRAGTVGVKQFGTLPGEGFRIEKLAYESLPGFWVTANLYLPASGAGPFPAAILQPGHEATGKLGQYNFGVNFARNGMVALAIDPLGQGERLQYFDAAAKASTIGGSTGEHGEANVPVLLLGENVARYFVNDAMRGIDYLISRKEVDRDRIGALGCSGGGTATAYLAALDDRVKAAGSACYITSFDELLRSATGVQEAEQSIPGFLAEGLDFADWVEAAAPRAYAVISTTSDMFPFEGARKTYDEVKRIYKLYGVEDDVQWITGPGGHGNLGPIAPAILSFFKRHLTGSTAEASFTPARIEKPADLLCTPPGQVATSLGGETVASLNRKHAESLLEAKRAVSGENDLKRRQARVLEDVRALTAVVARPGTAAVTLDTGAKEQRSGYALEMITMHSEPGGEIAGVVAIPERPGVKPAVVLMESQPKEKLAAVGGDLDRLAQSGKLVVALEARPAPPGTESIKSPYLGVYNLLSLHAFLVGKTLVGMRMDDVIRAVDWLSLRSDVDRAAITAYGSGPFGVVMLHAAALDTRVRRIVIENTLTSYRMIVDQPVHRNVSEVVIPAVLRKYDLADLLVALHPRPVVVISPKDSLGTDVPETEFQKQMTHVFESDRVLGTPQRISLRQRSADGALPIE